MKYLLLIVSTLFFLPSAVYAKLDCKNIEAKAAKYNHIILAASHKYKVDSELIHSVIRQESCYNKYAVSKAGAEGLMQLMPITAKRFNVKNSFNEVENIFAGTRYLGWLKNRFKGDLKLTLAGYNAGEGNVDKYNGIPPFKETRNYVKVVLNTFRKLSGNSNKNTTIATNHNSVLSVYKSTATKVMLDDYLPFLPKEKIVKHSFLSSEKTKFKLYLVDQNKNFFVNTDDKIIH